MLPVLKILLLKQRLSCVYYGLNTNTYFCINGSLLYTRNYAITIETNSRVPSQIGGVDEQNSGSGHRGGSSGFQVRDLEKESHGRVEGDTLVGGEGQHLKGIAITIIFDFIKKLFSICFENLYENITYWSYMNEISIMLIVWYHIEICTNYQMYIYTQKLTCYAHV